MKKFRKKYWLSILVLLLLIVSFLFGPLFPWSPVKPGYQTREAEQFTLYSPTDRAIPEFYSSLDAEITTLSAALELPVKRDIKIIRTEKSAFQGYMPWLRTESLGGVALQTGNVLFVSYEKIAERQLSEQEFVKHELIHIILHQNSTLGNALRAGSITYISEGVPFYLGGPNYFPKNEFIEKIKPIDLKETTKGDAIYEDGTFNSLDEASGDRYKVSHMLYGEFVRYLVTTYGTNKFNAFNKAVLQDPGAHRKLFEEHFEMKLEAALQIFEEQLKANAPAQGGS